MQVKHILVVNRLTQYTADVLRQGVALAKQFGADLCVLRVITNPVNMEAVNAPGLFIKGEEYRNYLSVREQYQEQLDRAVQQVVKDAVPIKEYVADHDTVNEVLRIVEKEKVDLVLVLAHQEGRLEHLLFGGENDALVRRLPCSILLVKHEPEGVPWDAST